ncbi:MAG: molybdenum cofactor biosynthesis protein MoaE [Thermoflexales bacterium]|nr:molybdenum cofactor biosynthesis protein MoaE [Thermoflexales bacterium]
MQITVRLFAALKERVGAKQVMVHVPDGASVAEMCEQLTRDYPALMPAMPTSIVAVNMQFAPPGQALGPDDEVALFPPVSGGSLPADRLSPPADICQVTAGELDVNDIVRRLARPTSGAVVTFTGVVRAAEGRDAPVTHLHYEAYQPMAEAKLRQVAAEMHERFPAIDAVALIQRTGQLSAGAPTIVVAVSSPHRDQGCFEAARYGIDRIKEIVPVWKKEIRPDGETWIEGHYRPQAGD